MKRVGKEPRLLPNVMEAIASLKEKQGSTQRQIVDHISHILRRNKETPRNVTLQIKRALEHGLNSGLIRHKSGKFTLGLDKKDYAIFRRFRQIDDPLGDCNSCKRGRRRGRRGKRGGRRRRSRRRGRRGRKRAVSAGEDASEDDSDSAQSIVGGTPEPMDRRGRRGRRKGRRGRKGRRRGRRGRRRTNPHGENSDSVESVSKESASAVIPEKRKSVPEKLGQEYQNKNPSNHNHHPERSNQDRNHMDRGHHEDDDIECGNPECLCGLKQENDSPRCMSRENYYHDSYLN